MNSFGFGFPIAGYVSYELLLVIGIDLRNRYQFLAFDFEETVEMTGDNCRLLLLRMKCEGWKLGQSKVFIKYYSEEFLSR